ncbi:DUF4864 domain-containing protein [Nitratireductor pacificus]|uniref:DUF4864 domain-containing protein n=1 Tax=Nitratireductor pacificus pht-3B TaxID=391937 RepID=K2M957_9HYPH|nr:DUF4864 domain-containing protein [Nitratireductor pacificus]EKF17565.1 hypothetical protein NA2_17519 [Nitratireductor pacificus pht-3B]
MRILLPLSALAALFGFQAVFAFAGEAEIRAAQATIRAQLEAFRAGDNERAYSYAAPSIKRMFPTLERFMGMVTGSYQPVYRPRDYAFGAAREPNGTTVMQRVLTTGTDGKNYEALYTLERQADGTYRITGVSLRETAGLSI